MWKVIPEEMLRAEEHKSNIGDIQVPVYGRWNREQRRGETMEVYGGSLQVVDQSWYLGEFLSCEAGADSSNKKNSSLLVNRKILLRDRVYL